MGLFHQYFDEPGSEDPQYFDVAASKYSINLFMNLNVGSEDFDDMK